MTIREAQEKDANVLILLLTQLGYPASMEDVLKRIQLYRQAEYKLMIGEVDGRAIGFIALHWYPAFHHSKLIGRVIAFCVDETFRSQGFGTLLLNYAED